ncbi:MAG: biotin-dependent carboxyltransferase family protein, partial [Micromonosporaceae bacterium]
RGGVRSYLAVRGGIAVRPVLGSRSTDTLSGLGPPVVRDGDQLPLGSPAGGASAAAGGDALGTLDRDASAVPGDGASAAAGGGVLAGAGDGAGAPGGEGGAVGVPPEKSTVELRVALGPRADWFSAAAVDTFLTSEYAVSPTSNRIGARLTGPTLERAVTDELPSEGVVLGAVQVPANGEPLIFLADHPTTGGYPVIAVVDTADIPLIGQARPGTPVRFVAGDPP